MMRDWRLIFSNTALLIRQSRMRRRKFIFRADIVRYTDDEKWDAIGHMESQCARAWPSHACKEEETRVFLGQDCIATIFDVGEKKTMSIGGVGDWLLSGFFEMRAVAIASGAPSIKIKTINGIYLRRLDRVARVTADVSDLEIARFYPFPYVRPWTESPHLRRWLPDLIKERFFARPKLFASDVPTEIGGDEKLGPLVAVSALKFCVQEALAALAIVE